MSDLEALIHRADPSELLLEIDRLVDRRDWDGLVMLRDRCEAAVELGKQLWPVAQFAEYRLALEAPGPYAAGVCQPGAGRFALGPLTEVAASTHRWDDLADHLPTPWIAATVAQERVIRGEDLSGDPRAHAEEFDLPLRLQPWEPPYPLPTYRPYDRHEGGPDPIDVEHRPAHAAPAPPVDLPHIKRALADVAGEWAERSNGGCHVVTVGGDAVGAAAGLLPDAVAIAPLSAADALARLAWTAASGGAYGRRRGMAAARSALMWFVHQATSLPFPADLDALNEAVVADLTWYHLAGGEGDRGWNLRLAVENRSAGWAAAIDAWDRFRDDADGATTNRPW
ncbi:MAG: hypothetical protein M3N57_13080 [Actinomycetota bacterium]|nr:hypothetical protein [Actinomycetota bacterium]